MFFTGFKPGFQAGDRRNALWVSEMVRPTYVMLNVTRVDDDLWFLHLGYKVTFPHCICVSFDVANDMMGR